MTGPCLSDHLRNAIRHLREARDELAHAVTVQQRECVAREIANAEQNVLRALHLIGE